MTFLNPLVLFGMAAAAIPVILHLLNLRKLRTIEFSTLRFLKELQQTKIRKLKVRQILLLIIRTLLVLFIVLAFARPAFRGTMLGSIGANAHSSVVLIVDDSFSMTASDERGELFKQAKESMAKIIDLLNEGDEVFLIKLSDLPEATIGQGSHDFRTLKKTVSDIPISPVTRPLGDAIRLSAKLLSQSRNANKEVYVISDMQQTLFNEELMAQKQTASLFDPTEKFFLVNVGSGSSENVAIDSVDIKTQIFEKDKPVTIYSTIRNYSNNTLQNYVVSVFLEGVRVAQNSVRLDPWGSASMNFSITPKKSGFLKGYVELEQDAIEQDNRRYFTFYIPEKISVALVSNSQSENKFTMLAFASGEAEAGQSLFNLKQVSQKDFQFLDLDTLDVLLLSFPDGLTSVGIDRVKTFVENGGGLILFPSSTFQSNDVTSSLLGSLSLSTVVGVTGSEHSQSSLSFKEIDFDHPVFATVFDKAQQSSLQAKQSVESPIILKTLKREMRKEDHAIITMSDGSPFLSESKLGTGKILFFSVAPSLTWSDFPVKGIFVPLVYRSAIYVSEKGKSNFNFTTGDEPILSIPNVTIAQRTGLYKLVAPDGQEDLISQSDPNEKSMATQKHVGSTLSVNLSKLTQPGFYQFKNQTDILSTIAVNTDKKESDLRKVEGDRLSKFWKQYGIESSSIRDLDRPDQVQKTVVESRFGVELWKHCLAIALLLALLEMILARDSRKEMQQALSEAAERA